MPFSLLLLDLELLSQTSIVQIPSEVLSYAWNNQKQFLNIHIHFVCFFYQLYFLLWFITDVLLRHCSIKSQVQFLHRK